MSVLEFDELEEQKPNKKNRWWWVLKLLTTILTAMATVFGLESCTIF